MVDLEVFNVTIGAVSDRKSARDAVNDLMKGVTDTIGSDGRIELLTDISVDIKDAKKNVKEAQKAVVDEWKSMMSKKGFSASADDLDILSKKLKNLNKLADKGGNSDDVTLTLINNTIGKIVDAYNDALKTIGKDVIKTNNKISTSKRGRKPRDFGPHSDEEIKANIKQEKERKYKGLEQIGPKEPRGGAIDPGRTNDHLTRVSEYSANGSQWATELAKILKIEMAKAAKSLVTWIEPNYKLGGEDNKIGLGNKNAKTTEKEFLTATVNKVKKEITDSIKRAESGDETVTLDSLKELVAIVKVLNTALGKTTEFTEKQIIGAMQKPYTASTKKRLGGTDLEPGKQQGVGPGHDYAQELIKGVHQAIGEWDNEIIAERISKEIDLGVATTKQSIDQATKAIEQIKLSGEFATELAKLNTVVTGVLTSLKMSTSATESQLSYDKLENTREAVADSNEQKINKTNSDINRDVARAVKQDLATGMNTDANANKLIKVCESILSALNIKPQEDKKGKPSDAIALPEGRKGLYKGIPGASIGQLALPKVDRRRKYMTTEPKSLIPSGPKLPALIPGEFAKTLKEAINPSVLDGIRISREKIGKVSSRTTKDIDDEERINNLNERTRTLADESNARKAYRKRLQEQQDAENSASAIRMGEEPRSNMVKKSRIHSSPLNNSIWDKWQSAIEKITGATDEYRKIIDATAEEQDEMAAKRVKEYGLNNGRNPNDTGDIASIKRSLELFRTNKASIESNPELAQKIKLTDGIEVNTTEVTKKFNKAMSGKEMRNAQMGGSPLRQVLGFFTGFAGMPSIEKSRAQADGLNQILGNVSKAFNSILDTIQMKETELSGMEKSGDIEFDSEGNVKRGSSAAKKTLADLEESKLVLQSLLADMGMVDKVIGKTGGKFNKIVRQLSFTSPVLRENNTIIRNINTGLDKNGKALKFQTRTAEILNYTFQLMSRHIGQLLKRLVTMLNPLNIMKRMFSFFSSYDVKWQRTMNVIKYNLRDVIKPIMESIAQLLVNMIGFADIILQKVQAAFGRTPISLFDQENAKKVKDEAEEIKNITAGFDELHDIGSDDPDKDANNLLGEIYKPKLSQEWIDLANEIGDLFAGLITGDLGFGEVMLKILKILGEGLALAAKAIWDWFKDTAIGKYLIDHWKEILATILAVFLGWQLLKIAGGALFNALFSKLTFTGIKGVFGKVGGWITKVLGATAFGKGIIEGLTSLLSGGGLLSTLKSIFVGHEAITAFGAWGETLGAVFAQSLLAIAGIALAGFSLAKGSDAMRKNTAYNAGLEQAGGNEEDKKSNVGAGVLSTLGSTAGGALAGFAIGGPIGAAIGAGIGAIAGIINTVLSPAIENATIKANEMNNEMQKIEYYEGAVQGASTQVSYFTELENLMAEAVENQTDKVYAQGEQLGISRDRMNELVTATQNGTFTTDLLAASEQGLSDGLIQLTDLQNKNKDASDKLTEAKNKLIKAETELAIAEDIAAGNFELAAARIEVAYASNVYTAEEATAKMVQIAKEGSAEQAAAILKDLSPDLQKKFQKEYSTTEQGLNELTDLYFDYSKDEREYFLQNLTGEVQKEMQSRVDAIGQAVQNAPWYMRLLDIGNDGKILGHTYIDVPGYAVGTNYVPNDGLAYLHKGEAVIPAKYNEGIGMQGKAYQQQSVMNDQMMAAIARLEATMAQGINVKGEFRQRGSDLVATVEKNQNRQSNNVLNNKVYAR